ncbi:Glucan 1,3-beta-glucosidase 3 [Clarireedia jacksonii]
MLPTNTRKMKKLVQRARSHISSGSSTDTPSVNNASHQSHSNSHLSTIRPPTKQDIIRYRQHFGANLGGIYVLEKWLFPSLFPASCKGDSELDHVLASKQTHGIPQTLSILSAHRSNPLTPTDLNWFLHTAHGTSIRLPIGYFSLPSQFSKNTPFAPFTELYTPVWPSILSLIHLLHTHHIGILIDLHALPGGANTSPHSGTSSSRADLWSHSDNLALAKSAILFLVTELRSEENIIGIQLCNEAAHGAGKTGMYEWYDDVLGAINEVDPSMPIYISDAWDLSEAVRWCRGRDWKRKNNGNGGGNPVVIDTHRYYTFSEKDRTRSPNDIITALRYEFTELAGNRSGTEIANGEGEVDVIVGEHSCVLDTQTWARLSTRECKAEVVKGFGQAQCERFESATAGSYFWTWKMQWMDGGEWGFKEQVERGNVRAPRYMMWEGEVVRGKLREARERRREWGERDMRGHEEYWVRRCPGKAFRFDFFGEGWDRGWDDAGAFFGGRVIGRRGGGSESVSGGGGAGAGDGAERKGADKIGCLEGWVRKRLEETGEKGEYLWEWEQGFRTGVTSFEKCVGL